MTLTLVTDKRDGGGIGTIPNIECDNEKCRHEASVEIPNTGIGHTRNNNNRVTDHAVNVQFVLSHLCSGDGGAEAEKTLGFLGLPCSTTMHNVFTKVEAAICPFVEELTKESLRDALCREIWATPERQPEGFSFHKWKEAVERHDTTCDPELCASVWLSMDMGWNKRSSGRTMDSLSGHSVVIATHTGNPIALSCKNKWCRKCCHFKYTPADLHPPPHVCFQNYDRTNSSGGMEAAALLEMVHRLYDLDFVVSTKIVIDDDTKMRAKLKWSKEDYIAHHKTNPPDNRKSSALRCPIPEPQFLADPAHRKKTFKNALYKFMSGKDPSTSGKVSKKGNPKPTSPYSTSLQFGEVDILRLSRNFTYMSHQLKDTPEDKWLSAGKAVLEHHFDNHEFCGDFCVRKKELKANFDDPKKHYRSKDDPKGKRLHELLQARIAPFITKDKLREISHGMHTNANESFNTLVMCVAPKFKTYSGSCSLKVRVCLVTGIKNYGFNQYMKLLWSRLKIAVTSSTYHFFEVIARQKQFQKDYKKKSKYKIKRNAKVYKKLREYMKMKSQAKKDDTECGAGIGFDLATASTAASTAASPAAVAADAAVDEAAVDAAAAAADAAAATAAAVDAAAHAAATAAVDAAVDAAAGKAKAKVTRKRKNKGAISRATKRNKAAETKAGMTTKASKTKANTKSKEAKSKKVTDKEDSKEEEKKMPAKKAPQRRQNVGELNEQEILDIDSNLELDELGGDDDDALEDGEEQDLLDVVDTADKSMEVHSIVTGFSLLDRSTNFH